MTFIVADVASDALSDIARALDTPVHLAALAALAVLAFEVGRIASETWRRVRPGTRPLQQIATRAMAEPADAQRIARAAPGPLSERAVVALASATATGGGEAIENALADYELDIQRRLDRTRILVRFGPALGLMGTLIPLAPGLGALGQGDFAKLAGDLQIAFAATVVGILVGTVAFALTLIRTRLYTEDLAALERAAAGGGWSHHRVPESVGDHST